MAETRDQVKGKYLYYKNKPLVREKDTICYGDFTEKCVLLFEIMSYVENEGVNRWLTTMTIKFSLYFF